MSMTKAGRARPRKSPSVAMRRRWPQEAARRFVAAAEAAIAARGRFTVALSGGSTPKALFRLLAAAPYMEQIDWSEAPPLLGR